MGQVERGEGMLGMRGNLSISQHEFKGSELGIIDLQENMADFNQVIHEG